MLDRSIVDAVCDKLAQGLSMRAICAEQGMPDRRTIERWMADDAEIAASIARARAVGLDERAEQAVEDAKTAQDPAKGRLAFDAERWYLSKIAPKKFGEAALLKVAGADGEGPVKTTSITREMSPAEAAEIYRSMISE